PSPHPNCQRSKARLTTHASTTGTGVPPSLLAPRCAEHYKIMGAPYSVNPPLAPADRAAGRNAKNAGRHAERVGRRRSLLHRSLLHRAPGPGSETAESPAPRLRTARPTSMVVAIAVQWQPRRSRRRGSCTNRLSLAWNESEGAMRVARVTARGAARWWRGHPWIYRSDVIDDPGPEPGAVRVEDTRGRFLGIALWSPASTISLRMLTSEDRVIDGEFWEERIDAAARYRAAVTAETTAYRLVHAEADGLPSLIVDVYGDVLVVQFLSAGLETFRDEIVDALR